VIPSAGGGLVKVFQPTKTNHLQRVMKLGLSAKRNQVARAASYIVGGGEKEGGGSGWGHGRTYHILLGRRVCIVF